MAEASAAGLHPHVFFDYTHRMLYAVLKGAILSEARERKASLWGAWMTANFQRAKKLPDLAPLLRKLDPVPVSMTAREIRAAVVGMAKAMGAKITQKKRNP